MRPHRVQQPADHSLQYLLEVYRMPTTVPPYSGPTAVVLHISHDSSVALAILLLTIPPK